MTLDITNDRIKIIGADGNATFDSNSRHFLITDYIPGSFPIEAVDAYNSGPRVFTRTHNKGAVNANANIVTGFHVDVFGQIQPIGGTHFAYAYNEFMRPDRYQTSTTGDYIFSTAVYYSFQIVNAQLQVIVDYRFPGGSEFPIGNITLQFWAFCGTFDF
jgi:hypothetical protein